MELIPKIYIKNKKITTEKQGKLTKLSAILKQIEKYKKEAFNNKEDICCYCGDVGADTVALPTFIEDALKRLYKSNWCHEQCEICLLRRNQK